MMNYKAYSLIVLIAIALIAESCKSTDKETMKNTKGIISESWGELDGKPVYLFTLTNSNGIQVKISNYGGTVISWNTPDRNGKTADIVIGFDSLSKYRQPGVPYFGAIVGRYANRIAKGKFTLNGTTYTLATNNGANHLHGGVKGFDKVVWDADTAGNALKLTYLSKDGEEGYPGNLTVTVFYSLTDENELTIDYQGVTDKPTPVNLSQHSYFNLSGNEETPILDHILTINADYYTPVDAGSIPTGELKPVKGTPFDFTMPHKIGSRIAEVPGGYDHNFVLNQPDSLKLAAILYDSASGRKLEVITTEPGLQFYTGNYLNGNLLNRNGKPINKQTGVCLETQHFPDSPNHPEFPPTILNPGEKYRTITKYKFSIQ